MSTTTTSTTTAATATATARPRVEGAREQEIYDAALEVLEEVGYDLLTMDAVATRARASKATLYRRWTSKPALVAGAVLSVKSRALDPDTGTLRGDLLASYCGPGGLTETRAQSVLSAIVTAMDRDPEFAEIYRRDFIDPKHAAAGRIFARAQARGEIPDGIDLDLLVPCLAGIVLHRAFLLGDEVTPELVGRVVDHVIIPAATRGAATPAD